MSPSRKGQNFSTAESEISTSPVAVNNDHSLITKYIPSVQHTKCLHEIWSLDKLPTSFCSLIWTLILGPPAKSSRKEGHHRRSHSPSPAAGGRGSDERDRHGSNRNKSGNRHTSRSPKKQHHPNPAKGTPSQPPPPPEPSSAQAPTQYNPYMSSGMYSSSFMSQEGSQNIRHLLGGGPPPPAAVAGAATAGSVPRPATSTTSYYTQPPPPAAPVATYGSASTAAYPPATGMPN